MYIYNTKLISDIWLKLRVEKQWEEKEKLELIILNSMTAK